MFFSSYYEEYCRTNKELKFTLRGDINMSFKKRATKEYSISVNRGYSNSTNVKYGFSNGEAASRI